MVVTALTLSISVILQSCFALPPYGVQSSGPGSSFGGQMVYNKDENAIFMTGSSYSDFWRVGDSASELAEPNCFLAVFSNDSNEWIHTDAFGSADIAESCGAVVSSSSSKVFMGGETEEGGLLTPLRAAGSTKSTQYGVIAEVDVDFRPDNTISSQLVGGRLIHETQVHSIHALAVDSRGEFVFSASVESDAAVINDNFDATVHQPNLLEQPKYGKNYYLNIQKFPIESNAPTSGISQTLGSARWNREIASTLRHVEVADLIFVSDSVLLLGGTARGIDQAIPYESLVEDDLDGFVTILDPATALIEDAKRLITGRKKVDRVEGLCIDPNGNGFYAIGSTNGPVEIETYEENQLTAVVWKLEMNLTISWAKQLDAVFGPLSTNADGPQITGKRCAVTDDGAHVYVGGIVEEGSIVNQSGHQSFGKDDIWIGKISTASQEWEYIRQLGTSQNEALVDIKVDKDGNALLMGNTDGSFMRRKEDGDKQTDVFLISLSAKTGDYPVPIEATFNGADGPQTPRPSSDAPPTDPPVYVPTLPPPITLPPSASEGPSDGAIIVIFVLAFCCLGLACLIFYTTSRASSAANDSAQVAEYLKGFDDIEVDVKRSATGGWHGTYINHDGGPRFYSKSGMPEETVQFEVGGDGETSPLTHSSIVRDSLFTDEEDDEGVSGFGRIERRGSTYDGLIDAYNTTWTDLSPHKLPSGMNRVSRISSGPPSQTTRLTDVDINAEEEDKWGREII